MRVLKSILFGCISFACFGNSGNPDFTLEVFHSRQLKRDVDISLHVPAPEVLAAWKASHPNGRGRLILFLPGAFDGPRDLVRYGVYAHVARLEASQEIAPALWVSVAHYRSWYADRKDGSFPYEKFLLEELIPEMEKRFAEFGGKAECRTVAGLSMGGFGALNLCGRTTLFSRCMALSPALVEPPFRMVGWFLRKSLEQTFPMEADAFAPWNPFKHVGGTFELYLGCGTEDKYGLASATKSLAELAKKPGRSVTLDLRRGKHDWDYWAPEFKRLVPWLHGGALPAESTALKMQQSVKTL